VGRFGAFVVRIVNDEAPRVQAIVAQDDSHTRYQDLVPGNGADPLSRETSYDLARGYTVCQ
jgi:hypothetical protein